MADGGPRVAARRSGSDDETGRRPGEPSHLLHDHATIPSKTQTVVVVVGEGGALRTARAQARATAAAVS